MNATTINTGTTNIGTLNTATRFLPFAGRLLLGGIFLMSGLSKTHRLYRDHSGYFRRRFAARPPRLRGRGDRRDWSGSAVADRISRASRRAGFGDLVPGDGDFFPQQFRGSEPDDPLPQEPADRGWIAADRALRRRSCQFGRAGGPLKCLPEARWPSDERHQRCRARGRQSRGEHLAERSARLRA